MNEIAFAKLPKAQGFPHHCQPNNEVPTIEKEFGMSDVLLCNRPLDPQQFSSRCGIGIDQLTTCGCTKPSFIAPNTPYLVRADSSNASILNLLSPAPVTRGLTDLSLAIGGDKLQEAARACLGR